MARTVPGSGAELRPIFNATYGVDSFIVDNGGSNYDPNDPPLIELPYSSTSPGLFYPVISGGAITAVIVLEPGLGYENVGYFETGSDIVEVVRRLPGNNIVGVTSFKLKSGDVPLFYREFDSSNSISTSINLSENQFLIQNHNFQTGQKIVYDHKGGTPIGIGTTSSVEVDVNIITEVGGEGGGSIYEDGYNRAISVPISGTSSDADLGINNKYFGFGSPLPSFAASGVGTGAKFEVFITYDSGSGSPISTSIILKEGGGNYSVGDQVGISGTYLDGATPANDLTFTVSKVSSSRIPGESGETYLNVPSLTLSGSGSGATFNVTRDEIGDISIIQVSYGGIGYALTSTIKIDGSNIGGSSGTDDAFISPVGLGTDVLPNVLYVNKLSDNTFRVQGTPNSNNLNISTLGVGTHSLSIDNPNANSLILIDNIIQSPLYIRNVDVELDQLVGIGSTNIYLSVGISSISGLDFLRIDDEYLKIESIGIGATNVVEVSRGYFGSEVASHNVGAAVTVVRGDYNIVEDSIYFSDAPYGKIGPDTLKVSSTFQGKAFSRSFDFASNPQDKNLVLDDISVDFTGEAFNVGIFTGTLSSDDRFRITGIDTTSLFAGDVINLEYSDDFLIKTNTRLESVGINSITISPFHNVFTGTATTTFSITRLNFVLTSNNETVNALYNDVNGSGIDINNNPFILVNNIYQKHEENITIDNYSNNTIKFLSGVPNAGKITQVSISTSFGYQPIVGAAASIVISGFGTVSELILTNYGSGYRVPPVISIGGTIGSGASFSANLGAGGTITSIDVINPGIGYTYRDEYFLDTGITQDIPSGSTRLFVNNTSNVTIGSSISVVGYGITTEEVLGVGSTYVDIGAGSTTPDSIPSGSRVIFTTYSLPEVLIPEPPQYSFIPLTYLNGTSGSGKNAKVSLSISNDSSVKTFKIDDPGFGYKKGDQLVATGILTDPNSGLNYNQLIFTVDKELTDKFSGFYPGQFVKVDDISVYFNGRRRKFTLTTTKFGIKEVLDLKVDPGVSLNLQNNIFVYINDILQEPNEAYVYNGTRIIFTEPPKENSTCEIYFYRGSSLDVEDIIPPDTIKEGDTVQILENKDNPYDIIQFERTVKKIISSSELDTFTYYSIGINTTSDLPRPLDWEKQNSDLIINGVLYSKGRPGLKSRNHPTSRIIKNVNLTDTKIYVENAFPLFSLDEERGVVEDDRNVILLERKTIENPVISCNVGSSSSITSIDIVDGGFGYDSGTNPELSISKSLIEIKDPVLNWISSGINSSIGELNSLDYGNYFIAVGSGGKYLTSDDGLDWLYGTTGINSNLNDIVIISNNYIGVGSDAKIIKGVGIGSTIPSWSEMKLSKEINQFGFIEIQDSNYDSTFNKISYMESSDILVAVGDYSSTIGYNPIFVSTGIGFTQFFEKATTNIKNLNSITNNGSHFVVVGQSGIIRYSSDGEVWTIVGDFDKPQNIQDLNDILWDGNKFIAVGNNSELVYSDNLTNWNRISNNLSSNLLKIKYQNNLYLILDDLGDLYYSFDLSFWEHRSTLQSNKLNNLLFVDVLGDYGRTIAIGSSTTIIYSEPVYNRATATTTVGSSSSITGITITNGGFGYNIASNPPAIVETENYNKEILKSVKVKGDFGTIVDVEPVGIAVTQIKFSLKSENYDNSTYQSNLGLPGIGYSSINTFRNEFGENIINTQLEVGDYFTIRDSNVTLNNNLTGITTFNGPIEYVGMTTSTDVPILISNGTINGSVITGIDTTRLEIGDKVSTYEVNYLPTGTTILSMGSSEIFLSGSISTTTELTSYVLFQRSLITLDGVYIAEEVSEADVSSGIVTVTCRFAEVPNGIDITQNLNIGSEKIYGTYSWSKIYGYQNRARANPKEFYAYTFNGLVGLDTSAEIYRERPLV